ncbi:11743_t:CDS:2, partial [Entrophospora sp. SA101]
CKLCALTKPKINCFYGCDFMAGIAQIMEQHYRQKHPFKSKEYFNEQQALNILKPLLTEHKLTLTFSDAAGQNVDIAKAKGCAETYAIKYFLTKFFLIPTTDELDPDITKSHEHSNRLKSGRQETPAEIQKRLHAKDQQKEAELKAKYAYLPPSFSEKCGKAVDPLCQNQCFKHCYNKDYPDNHYLRCKNPQHPPYQESKFLKQFKQSQAKIQQLLWQYPYATADVSHLTKPKLKNAIRRDIQLLQEILPLEDCLIPNEDDPEM